MRSLKRKLRKHKFPNLKRWLLKALSVAVFAVISISVIATLLIYGDIATSQFEVVLGGGQRIEEIFADQNNNEPPSLPPINLPPTVEKPSQSNPTYVPNYSPCNLLPLPTQLLCDVQYSTVNTFDQNSLTVIFSTSNRIALFNIWHGNIKHEFNVLFIVTGTDRLQTTLKSGNYVFMFNIYVSVGSLVIHCKEFLAFAGLYNPFEPSITLFADWII